jgi:hypothetical protein
VDVARAAAHYRALHEGLAPDRVARRTPQGPVGSVGWELGEMSAVEYRKPVPPGTPGARWVRRGGRWRAVKLYRHPFADATGPEIWHDRAGQMHLAGGHYQVTRRGIEDREPPGGDGETMRELALYNPEQGVLSEMWDGTKMGLTAGAGVFGTAYLLRKTNMGFAARGVVGALPQFAVAILAGRMGWGSVAGGLFGSGWVTLIAGLAQEVTARRALSAAPQPVGSTSQTTTTTGTGAAPGAGVTLPAGWPMATNAPGRDKVLVGGMR